MFSDKLSSCYQQRSDQEHQKRESIVHLENLNDESNNQIVYIILLIKNFNEIKKRLIKIKNKKKIKRKKLLISLFKCHHFYYPSYQWPQSPVKPST